MTFVQRFLLAPALAGAFIAGIAGCSSANTVSGIPATTQSLPAQPSRPTHRRPHCASCIEISVQAQPIAPATRIAADVPFSYSVKFANNMAVAEGGLGGKFSPLAQMINVPAALGTPVPTVTGLGQNGCSGSQVTWSAASPTSVTIQNITLAAGASCTVVVLAQVPVVGTYTVEPSDFTLISSTEVAPGLDPSEFTAGPPGDQLFVPEQGGAIGTNYASAAPGIEVYTAGTKTLQCLITSPVITNPGAFATDRYTGALYLANLESNVVYVLPYTSFGSACTGGATVALPASAFKSFTAPTSSYVYSMTSLINGYLLLGLGGSVAEVNLTGQQLASVTLPGIAAAQKVAADQGGSNVFSAWDVAASSGYSDPMYYEAYTTSMNSAALTSRCGPLTVSSNLPIGDLPQGAEVNIPDAQIAAADGYVWFTDAAGAVPFIIQPAEHAHITKPAIGADAFVSLFQPCSIEPSYQAMLVTPAEAYDRTNATNIAVDTSNAQMNAAIETDAAANLSGMQHNAAFAVDSWPGSLTMAYDNPAQQIQSNLVYAAQTPAETVNSQGTQLQFGW